MSFGIGFLSGCMTWTIFYAMFKGSEEAEAELEQENVDEETDVVVNSPSGRLHTLYCENCRKKKRHREIVPRKFECTRCRRITDLRMPS